MTGFIISYVSHEPQCSYLRNTQPMASPTPHPHNAYLLRIELKDFKPAIFPNLRKWQKPTPDAWGEPMGNDAKVKLCELLTAPTQRLLYLYDFGDEWLHTITLLAFNEAHVPLPHLLKAQNGCPPEDCGGPPGAEYWAAAWYDATHEDHETALDMFGDQEPGFLDFVALQAAVAKLKKPVR